jgi:hypothetical protein
MRNINVIVLPGEGRRVVSIEQGVTTWGDLVASQGLFGRDLVGNVTGVTTEQYGQTIPSTIRDVFATASVKGN